MNEGSSSSTVKKIYEEFVGYALPSSLEEAAESYSVKEEIEILREIACDARKAGSSFPALLEGAHLSRLMKKLGLSPVYLEDIIKALDKHKDRFGDFVQSALRLSSLEEETGKTYNALIRQYENTKKNIAKLSKEIDQTRAKFSEEEKEAKKKTASLNNRIDSLNEEIQTRETKLIRLDERAQKAQTVLDRFERTRNELHTYGLSYDDFTTVKNLLNSTQKLGGNAAKVVQIIDECDSLENKLSKLKIEIGESQRQQSKEELIHERIIEDLEAKESNLKDRIAEDENKIKTLGTEKNTLKEKITKLQENRQQLATQVDGLQKTQAEMLQVQPDIDVIYETIPVRKEELKELEEKIVTKMYALSVTVALENLLQKRPADRKALINWLQFGGISKEFKSSDEQARQTITEILAKEGYVPKSDLDSARRNYEREIDGAKEETEIWKRRGDRRLKEFEECQELLKETSKALNKENYAELYDRITSLLAKGLSKLIE